MTGHLVGEFESSTTTWLNWNAIKDQHSPIQHESLPVFVIMTISIASSVAVYFCYALHALSTVRAHDKSYVASTFLKVS